VILRLHARVLDQCTGVGGEPRVRARDMPVDLRYLINAPGLLQCQNCPEYVIRRVQRFDKRSEGVKKCS
jgi:hypothetical protein